MKAVKRRDNIGNKPTACVSRYGAFGDAILVSPVLQKLHEDGYYVVFNCNDRCYKVQKKNPYIDYFLIHEDGEIAPNMLHKWWAELGKKFDRWINLSGTIEGELLVVPEHEAYTWPKWKRHAACNRNYQDETMLKAGYPEAKGLLPSMHFTEREETWARAFREKHKGFLVLYCLSGSSFHKTYPYVDSVVQAIVEGLPDATVVLVGEKGAHNIIDPHERVLDLCGEHGIRKSLILTKYADLVISPETAIASGASCYDTPKIVYLSHSTEENLTKYWKNCHVIVPSVSCYPCHQLHYDLNSCPVEENIKLPICVALLHPKLVLDKVETVYEEYSAKKKVPVKFE